VEGRLVVVVEGAQALEGGARGPQGHVAADDINDVVGFLDLLDHGSQVVGQGPPVGRKNGKGDPCAGGRCVVGERRKVSSLEAVGKGPWPAGPRHGASARGLSPEGETRRGSGPTPRLFRK